MTWKARTRITVGLTQGSAATGKHKTIPHDGEIHKIYADMGESDLDFSGTTPDVDDMRDHLLDLVETHSGWSISEFPVSQVSVDGVWAPYEPSILNASFKLLKSDAHYTVDFVGEDPTGTITVSYYAEVKVFQG